MKDGGLTQKNYNLTRQSLPPHLSSDDPLSPQTMSTRQLKQQLTHQQEE